VTTYQCGLILIDSETGTVAINPTHVRCIVDGAVHGLEAGLVVILCGPDAIVVRGGVRDVADRLVFRMQQIERDAPVDPLTIPIARDGFPFPRGAEPGAEPAPAPEPEPALHSAEAIVCMMRPPAQRPAPEVIEHVLTSLPPLQLQQCMMDTAGMAPEIRPWACLVRACECNYLDWSVTNI
jgi:hypothetical protein